MGELAVKEAKVENVVAEKAPESIKDIFAANLRAAANRVPGRTDEAHELRMLLKSQALHSEESTIENTGLAFFSAARGAQYEDGLSKSNNQIVIQFAEKTILTRINGIANYPENPLTAARFDAIVTESLKNSINTRALQLGQELVVPPVAAVDANKGNVAQVDNKQAEAAR